MVHFDKIYIGFKFDQGTKYFVKFALSAEFLWISGQSVKTSLLDISNQFLSQNINDFEKESFPQSRKILYT